MSVTSATSVGAATVSEPKTGPNAVLGKDAFLKLLITQLRTQDPLNAMEDKEFIAQLATFSTLEQTNEMATGLQTMALSNASTQAMDMMGRSVQYVDPKSGDIVEGKVSSVKLTSDGPRLMVGRLELTLSDVVGVDNPAVGFDSSQAMSMLGKSIRYIDPKTGAILDGTVDSVDVRADGSTLVVGNTRLTTDYVLGVNDADSSTAATQALALLGRSVAYTVPGTDETKTGTVDAVRISSGVPVLIVGDRTVAMSDVAAVV